MPDPEIEALATIAGVLSGLEEEQRSNVLSYVNTRYGGGSTSPKPQADPLAPRSPAEASAMCSPTEFDQIGEFFDAADPSTEADRVLVIGYWLQEVEGEADFGSAPVSKHLKNLGHAVSNVTRAFDDAMKASPRLVIQVSKNGTSRQARKKFKLTREGVKRVDRMLQMQTSGE